MAAISAVRSSGLAVQKDNCLRYPIDIRRTRITNYWSNDWKRTISLRDDYAQKFGDNDHVFALAQRRCWSGKDSQCRSAKKNGTTINKLDEEIKLLEAIKGRQVWSVGKSDSGAATNQLPR